MDKKLVITALYNEKKPIKYEQSLFKEKDGGMYMNFTESIITQMVKARNEDEFKAICERIQEFIEREGIDICFAINQNELLDCLDEHKKLKLQIADLEAKLAEMQCKSYMLYSMLYKTLENQGCENIASQIDQMTDYTFEKEADWFKGNRNYDQLKQQLEEEKNRSKKLNHEAQKYYEDAYCNNFQNQTAIEELEKVKEKVLQETNRVEEIYSDGLQSGFNCCYVFTREIIDQQIAELKEEK